MQKYKNLNDSPQNTPLDMQAANVRAGISFLRLSEPHRKAGHKAGLAGKRQALGKCLGRLAL